MRHYSEILTKFNPFLTMNLSWTLEIRAIIFAGLHLVSLCQTTKMLSVVKIERKL